MTILERLRGVAGVTQLVEAPRYPGSIVTEDVDGTSLIGLSTPVDVDELIELAVGLARAVAGLHRRGVMHRDITPANVVISRTGAACLVDFALAMSLSEIRPEFTHHTQIVGTLAYLAPEQTEPSWVRERLGFRPPRPVGRWCQHTRLPTLLGSYSRLMSGFFRGCTSAPTRRSRARPRAVQPSSVRLRSV